MAAVLNFFNVNSTNLSATPVAPDLDPAKDSGFSPSDNITNFNNSTGVKALSFTVGGTSAGATVTIYADGNPIGSAVAGGSSTTVLTNGALALADGSHLFTATQTEPFKLPSSSSSNLSVRIDTTAPTASPLAFSYETTQLLYYTFSESMNPAFSSSSIVVTDVTGGFDVNTTGVFGIQSLRGTFMFPDGILPNGNYQATLNGPMITDLAGNSLASSPTETFFFVNADANRDRTVNALDFNALATNFGLVGGTFSQGNFNYDGGVNTLDFNVLAAGFGTSLPAPATALSDSVAPLTASMPVQAPALFGSHRIDDVEPLQSLLA
jgi:hypothetical protein